MGLKRSSALPDIRVLLVDFTEDEITAKWGPRKASGLQSHGNQASTLLPYLATRFNRYHVDTRLEQLLRVDKKVTGFSTGGECCSSAKLEGGGINLRPEISAVKAVQPGIDQS
ncbi:hypothetical protein WG66_010267 [Moniliophthora roreri]|nr:hypothetical protein WG66_010267 [Moniliophthora roreri]